MSDPAKILLLGNGATALSALDSLASECEVAGVVRESSEGKESTDEVAARAAELGIPVYRDATASAVDRLIDALRPACVVVSSYNRILGSDMLRRCPFVNVHYAPLPRYRGRACVNWAIINGEPFSAITIHEMTEELDAGDILFQRLLPLEPSDTVTTVYARLNAIQREQLAVVVRRYLEGVKGIPQQHHKASYGCTRVAEDGQISWAATTRECHAMVRALAPPFPGARTYLGGRPLIVWEAEPMIDPPRYDGRVPGKVVGVSRQSGSVDVLTGDGVLRISRVQPEGAGILPAAEVIRSVRITLGNGVEQMSERIRNLEQRVNQLESIVNRHQNERTNEN